MGTRDPHIDAYIERSNEFARPILMHLRQVIHSTCPTVQETTKWSVPFFMYGGSNLASMAAFKQHCAFGFWKGSQIVENDAATEKAMGQFGRITSLADLPSAVVLKRYIKAAMQLNDEKTAVPRAAKKRVKPELAMPDDLKKALARTRDARRNSRASHRAAGANTSSGSKKRRATPRGSAGSRPRPSGSRKTSPGTGSTRNHDRVPETRIRLGQAHMIPRIEGLFSLKQLADTAAQP